VALEVPREIRVLDEPSVEDLVDTGDHRLPRANPSVWNRHEATIVQDARGRPGLDGVRGPRPPERGSGGAAGSSTTIERAALSVVLATLLVATVALLWV
jgi:hypothetical protein